MKKIKVELGKRSYYIWIGEDILSELGAVVAGMSLGRAAYIVTNKKIRSLFGNRLKGSLAENGLEAKFCIIPDSEKSKSSGVWLKVLKGLANFDKGKGAVVIALGGGVAGDLTGFVASTYRRGAPFIQVPTTLLAQVDSAIGGKVAIDIECAKNLVGAFYQPRAVLSDISVLKTLSMRQIRNGLAEIIKYGVILDGNLFSYLERNISQILRLNTICLQHIVERCSVLKAKVVSRDEREELGYRSILNFGHTIGHAAETATSYRKSLSHGEAVSIGMLCAFDIAVLLGMADGKVSRRVEALIKKAGLPTTIKGVSISAVLKATSYDKKIVKGKRRWILPLGIGHVAVCHTVPSGIVKAAVVKRIIE